jgi:hypothetical protein
MKIRMATLAFAFTLLATAAIAQQETPQTDLPPCSAAEHRQFDFWLGEWEVTMNGKAAGTNTITTILGGCVIMEEWQSEGSAFSGKSFNRYDPVSGKWEQVWVDNTGGVLRLAGEYKDGKMVLAGKHVVGGETVVDRITWHNNDDGTVRQVWEKSKDDGENWNAVFDGVYTKKK